MHLTRSTFIVILLLLAIAGCSDAEDANTGAGSAEPTTAEQPDTTASVPAEQSSLELAVDAIGGTDSLMGVQLLRIEASGNRRIDYEGIEPDELLDASTYSSTYLFDLTTGALRVDTTRTALFEAFQFFPPEEYGIVINGEVGGLTAQAGFFPPGPLPSQHVGALVQQQRLFNPHILLRAALEDPALAGDGGEEDFDGRPHRVLTVMEDGREVRLLIDSETGLISKLETMENNPLFRDVPIEIRYSGWQAHGTLMFPSGVELYTAGGLLHDEVRSAVEVEPTDVADDAFALPAEAEGAQVDADALAFGRKSHHVVDAFFQIFFGYDMGQALAVSELAPGVTLLGAGHNSVAVAVDGGLVVIEAPISPAHGSHIVEVLGEEYPGEPISHVIQTHFHQDHSAGVRSLAAEGATVVVGPGFRPLFESVLAAPSTLRPDALSQRGSQAAIEEIPSDGSLVIADDTVSITSHHVAANPHAEDMAIMVVETGDQMIVYVADLYNAGVGFSPVLGGPESFFAAMRDLGLIDHSCESEVPMTIVPSHGVAQSLEASVTELEGLDLDIG